METSPRRLELQQPPTRVFLAASIVVFVLSLSAADSVGFVPYYVDGSTPTHSAVPLSSLPMLGEEDTRTPGVLPDRIIIPAIDLDLSVQNPATKDLEALDMLLQAGPVRYADSARLGEKGNVLVFAHSSHLPIVHNQMFKAFNRVPELAPGDVIVLDGAGALFTYTVVSVRTINADEGFIDLSPDGGKRLTLVTCDTLTSKESRFIVEAVLAQ